MIIYKYVCFIYFLKNDIWLFICSLQAGEDLIDMTESSQKEDDNNSLPEVIDLTGDEDEDEELQAAKLLSLAGITNKEWG